MDVFFTALSDFFRLGGISILCLTGFAAAALAIALTKLRHFKHAGVGQHQKLQLAVAAFDQGNPSGCQKLLKGTGSYLAPIVAQALEQLPHNSPMLRQRLEDEAEVRFMHLESGLGALNRLAKLSPALGLLGTLWGLITSLRAQSAGLNLQLLIGDLWAALLPLALGLIIALPTALIVTWLRSQIKTERVLAATLWSALITPYHSARDSAEISR